MAGLYGSSTDEQRRSSGKDRQPGGPFSNGRLAALLLSQRALRLSSFVAPCQPPVRKQRAPSSFCYTLYKQPMRPRTGKTARLPEPIRQQLNQHLHNGFSAREL